MAYQTTRNIPVSKIIKFSSFYYHYSQFNGKFWMVRLARPKDKKYGDHAIEIASPDLTHRMIIQPESEAHANTFTSAFRRQMQKENDANLDSLNILLKNNAVFNNSDMHWKDLNQSRKLLTIVINRLSVRTIRELNIKLIKFVQ